MNRVVPLSLIGTHLVGLPTEGALVIVPAPTPAPFENEVVVVIIVVLLVLNPFPDPVIIMFPACDIDAPES
jgi:hypothetical protein